MFSAFFHHGGDHRDGHHGGHRGDRRGGHRGGHRGVHHGDRRGGEPRLIATIIKSHQVLPSPPCHQVTSLC